SFWPNYMRKYRYYGLKTLELRALREISKLSIPYGFATLFMMAGFGIFLKIVGMVDQQIIEASISSLGFWRPEELPSLRALSAHPFLGDLQLHVVSSRPPVYVAAAKVIIDLMSVCFMTCLAFGTGTATFVSQSLGGQRPDLAQRYIVESLKIGVLSMVLIGGLCIVSPETLFMVFSRDMEVVAAGRTSLQLMGGSMVFAALALVTAQALSGAGNTDFVMKVEGVLMIAWLIPAAYIFGMVLELGLFGIWTSVALYMVLMAVAMLWKLFKGDWKEIQL
ncbi:MAG: MATE family efflux transporter, partial [Myxococcota bacterium]|nr:MATE family efflux transporter [Myxococcota bacterium]